MNQTPDLEVNRYRYADPLAFGHLASSSFYLTIQDLRLEILLHHQFSFSGISLYCFSLQRSFFPPVTFAEKWRRVAGNCSKITLRSTHYGRVSIHSLSKEMHKEINARNTYFDHTEDLIQLAFSASVNDPYFATNRTEMNEEEEVGTYSDYLEMKNFTKCITPEVLHTRMGGQRYEGFTQISDIWKFLGLVTLELAYGNFVKTTLAYGLSDIWEFLGLSIGKVGVELRFL